MFRIPILVAIGFAAAATAIVLSGRERLPYFLGQTLTQPVLSRVTFERVNQLRTAEVRKLAQQEVPNYYRLNRALLDGIQAEFRDLLAAVKSAEALEHFTAAAGERWSLDEQAFAALHRLADDAGSAKFRRETESIVQRVAGQDMVLRAEVEREIRSTAGIVKLDRGDGIFIPVPKERLTYAVNSDHVDRLAQRAVKQAFDPSVRPALISIIKSAITPDHDRLDPVYLFDVDYTKKQIDEAGMLAAVTDSYQVGDRLVQAGVLDGEGLALLQAEHEEFLAQRRIDPILIGQWREEVAGLLGIVLLISAGLSIFTDRTHSRVAQNPARAMGLALLLLLMLLADRVVIVGMGASPIWSIATTAMTAAILTIAYSQLFAIGVAAMLAMMTILTLEASFGMLIIHLVVAAATALMLRDIRTRLRMVEVGGMTALAASAGALAVGLMQQQSAQTVAKLAAFAALASFAGISIVLVLLPVIERAFQITTSLTLLEWADTSNPLLRHLIEKAPGTWQHSHLLGSMAEAAAEEIGANGLLVRVGAYYHDIGKTFKPEYFVENQRGKMNVHDRLAPTMSLLVILAHVKDGLAMAREHGLPRMLHSFIAEHHGTTVVRYFHAIAAQGAKASGGRDRPVSETEFRYPGPKPQSRESAILMLCDGVEGAVRSLQDPTPGRIESVVHEITMARLMDGQFDACDITLKELSRVEQSLVKSLRAFHHGRIAYPKSPEGQAPQVHIA